MPGIVISGKWFVGQALYPAVPRNHQLPYKTDLQGRLPSRPYISTICSNGAVGAAAKTAHRNHLLPPLQISPVVVKWRSHKLQSCITFRDLQVSFWLLVRLRPFEKKSNFKCEEIQMQFFLDRWIQIKKLSTRKWHNFSTTTTIIYVVSPSEVFWKIRISNLRYWKEFFSCLDNFK